MNKSDFTGMWRFNREKSVLEIPSPDSTTFVIEHREPYFHLERTHTFGKSSDTFSIDLTTDGKIVNRNHGGIEIRAQLFWESEVLVFYAELSRENERGTNIVRYQLADNGQTFIAYEQLSFEGHCYKKQMGF